MTDPNKEKKPRHSTASALTCLLARIPHTKDGKPILWGDKVYLPDPDRVTICRDMDVVEGRVECITIGVSFPEYAGTHTVMFGDFECGNLELYSQRELVPLEPAFSTEC